MNPDDIARLVVFDNGTLNCDRHPPDLNVRKPNYDNVFLSADEAAEGQFRIVAMDHTHCFNCGRDLTERVATIDRTKDERVYGLFPGFVPFLRDRRHVVKEACRRLCAFNSETCRAIVSSIPDEWEVVEAARLALCDLVCQRATFVADRIIDLLAPDCWPQGEFDFDAEGDKR